MSELTVMEATRQGLIEEMRRDPRVWALGEYLARGGVFGQYAAMVEEFGKQRIVTTPITRPTQSLVALRLKNVPWPQSC